MTSVVTAPAPAIFASILNRLMRHVAMRDRKGPDPLLLAEVVRYLRSVRNRFATLAEKIRSGTLRPPRPRAARPADARPPDTPRRPRPRRPRPRRPGPRLPRGFASLIRLVPYEAAASASQLRHLFENNPEMAALLAAAPGEMGRLLRPLCHMLGMEPPAVLRRPLPPAPEGAADAGTAGEPEPPRPRKKRAKKVRWRMARMPPERGLIFY